MMRVLIGVHRSGVGHHPIRRDALRPPGAAAPRPPPGRHRPRREAAPSPRGCGGCGRRWRPLPGASPGTGTGGSEPGPPVRRGRASRRRTRRRPDRRRRGCAGPSNPWTIRRSSGASALCTARSSGATASFGSVETRTSGAVGHRRHYTDGLPAGKRFFGEYLSVDGLHPGRSMGGREPGLHSAAPGLAHAPRALPLDERGL